MNFFTKKEIGYHTEYNILGVKLKFKHKPKHIEKISLIFPSEMGIGNRLFGLINVINYFSPSEINICWPTEGWVTSSLKELFDINLPITINEFNQKEPLLEKKVNMIIDPPHVALLSKDGYKLSYKYEKHLPKDLKICSEIFEKIQPSLKVLNKINSVKEDFKYAIQIRNNPDWDKFGRNESLEAFLDALKNFPKPEKIYLSAMNKDTSEFLKNKLGDRIFELPEKNYSSMIDAVADLYLLSKAENVIFSYGSSFCDLAFWLNGAKQNVVSVGSDSHWVL